jgi:hypothetical protein
MWIVIDTNQTESLPAELSKSGATPSAEGISIPAFVLAELLLYHPAPRLKLLAFKTRVGLTPFEVMNQLARFQAAEIISFKPFRSTQSPYQDQLTSILRDSTPSHKQWAKTCKESNRQFSGRMQRASTGFRHMIGDMVAKKVLPEAPKFSDFEMLMNAPGISLGTSSFLGSMVINLISDGGQRAVAVTDPDELYAAVMQNPYLSRFFKTILYYVISYSQAWDHTSQVHNFGPGEKRDDWTDIAIPLYAGSKDIIVTADKKLKGAVAMVDPNGDVRTVLAKEL